MKRQQAAEADSTSVKRQRAEHRGGVYHPISDLQHAVLPGTVSSISGVMRLIDEFALTNSQAAKVAVKRGDLSTLTRILQRESAAQEDFSLAFVVAATRGDLKAVDAIAEHDDWNGYGYLLNDGILEGKLGDAMERGDRETAMHLWDRFFDHSTPSYDDTVTGAAIKFGYPTILEEMLLAKVSESEGLEFDPGYDELETHMETAVELGDQTSVNMLCECFPEECFEWAVRKKNVTVLQTASFCNKETRVEVCIDAIANGASAEFVETMYGFCDDFSRDDLVSVVTEAVKSSRMDVLEWIQGMETISDAVAEIALMQSKAFEQFQSIYEFWGHLVADEQIQGVFLHTVKKGRREIAEFIAQQRDISADTLDTAITTAWEPSVMQFLCEKGGSQVARDTAFQGAAERNELDVLKIIHEFGVSSTAMENAFVAACINGLSIIKFLDSKVSIPKEAALRAAEITIKRLLYTVFEYLYVQHDLKNYANELFSTAVNANAVTVLQLLFSDTSRQVTLKAYEKAVRQKRLKVYTFLDSSIQGIPDETIQKIFKSACRSNNVQVVAKYVGHRSVHQELVEIEVVEAAHNRRNGTLTTILRNRSISRETATRALRMNISSYGIRNLLRNYAK